VLKRPFQHPASGASIGWLCLGALLALSSGCSSGASAAPKAPERRTGSAASSEEGAPASGGEVFLWSLPLTVSDAARELASRGGSAEEVGRQLRLGFRLQGDDPAKATTELRRRFPHLSFDKADPSLIEIAPLAGPPQPVQHERREATFVIDYDEPSVQELLAGVPEGPKSPEALEGFVSSTLEKTHGRGFDIASRVATLKKGDCTEHAVLLTALLRASGHSARVVVGVVVLLAPRGAAAAGHAWVEVARDGAWRVLDSALLGSREDRVVLLYLPTVVLEEEGPSYGKDLIVHAAARTPQDLRLDVVLAGETAAGETAVGERAGDTAAPH